MAVPQISDTARWVAYARALESERPDALFQDPYARRLAGDSGEELARRMGSAPVIARAIAVRTVALDELILQQISQQGVGRVISLAAGLDTRPWRLELPRSLQWVDVDLPAVIDHKQSVLRGDSPTCDYRALAADLREERQRAELFASLAADARTVLVLTEGFLVYLSSQQVTRLAQALREFPTIRWWLTDLVGPQSLHVLRRAWGPVLGEGEGTFQFAPADSAAFFSAAGWHEIEYRSSREEARRHGRSMPVPLLIRLMLWLGSASKREEFRRLSGIALLRAGT